MLSTIPEVAEVVTKRKYNGEILLKPIVVHHYNICMNSYEKTDYLLSSYMALKGKKWYRKLFLHIFNMTLLNSYILNCKYGEKTITCCIQRIHSKPLNNNIIAICYMYSKEATNKPRIRTWQAQRKAFSHENGQYM